MTYDDLLKHFRVDSGPKLCAALEAIGYPVSHQTPYNWRKNGIPFAAQAVIESLTGGRKLRADLPQFLRKQAA